MSDGSPLHDDPGEVRPMPARAGDRRPLNPLLWLAAGGILVGTLVWVGHSDDDTPRPPGALPEGPGEFEDSALALTTEQIRALEAMWRAADAGSKVTERVSTYAPAYGDQEVVDWAAGTFADFQFVQDQVATFLTRAAPDAERHRAIPPETILPARFESYEAGTATEAASYVAQLWQNIDNYASTINSADVGELVRFANTVSGSAPDARDWAQDVARGAPSEPTSLSPGGEQDLVESDADKVQKIGQLAAELERVSNIPPGYGIAGAEEELDASYEAARDLRRAADGMRDVTVEQKSPAGAPGSPSEVGHTVINGWKTIRSAGGTLATSSPDPDIKAFGDRARTAADSVLPQLHAARDAGVLPITLADARQQVTSAFLRTPVDRTTAATAPASGGAVTVGSDGSITVSGRVVNDGVPVGAKAAHQSAGKYTGVVRL